MHKLYTPETELDLAFLKSLLEAEGIDFFVHNDHYGSMTIGPKIDLLNAKTIYVGDVDKDKAELVVADYLSEQVTEEVAEDSVSAFSLWAKLRVILETLLFWWFIPQGRRWKKTDKRVDS